MFNEYFGVIVGTWYQNVQIDKRRMLTLQIISYLVRSTCHYQVQVIFPSLGTTSKAFRFVWCKKIRSLTFTMMGTVESEANLGDMSRVYLIFISFCLHFVWLLRNCDIFFIILIFLGCWGWIKVTLQEFISHIFSFFVFQEVWLL